MRPGILTLFFLFLCLTVRAQDIDYLVVDRISITGNKVTHPKVILREMDLAAGDTIPKKEIMERLNNSNSNLQNTLLFNFVYLDFLPEGNRIEVRVELTERWYIWPIPIFEHAERNFPSWLKDPDFDQLNYGLWLKWNNFRGRREVLQFKARLGYKEQYSISYNKPNIGRGQKHGISFHLNSFRQHEVILRTEDNRPVYLSNKNDNLTTSINPYISYTFRPGFYTRHSISFAYSRLLFKADSLRFEYAGEKPGEDIHWFEVNYGLEYDNRDYKVYPLHGNFFKLGILRRGLGFLEDYSYPKTWLTLAGTSHRQIGSLIYFENGLKLRFTEDKYMPYIYRQGLGFDTYLRGYEYYLVDGNSYLLMVNNLKYNMLPQRTFNLPLVPWEQFNKVHFSLYSNIFFDFSYVKGDYYNVNGNNLTNKLLWSTGMGIDLVSYYDQVYRFEFTINSLGEMGFFMHLETPFRRW